MNELILDKSLNIWYNLFSYLVKCIDNITLLLRNISLYNARLTLVG